MNIIGAGETASHADNGNWVVRISFCLNERFGLRIAGAEMSCQRFYRWVVIGQCGRQRQAEPLFKIARQSRGVDRIETIASKRLRHINVRGRHIQLTGNFADQPCFNFFLPLCICRFWKRFFRDAFRRFGFCRLLLIIGMPDSYLLQIIIQKADTTGISLNLAARCFRNPPWFYEHEGVELQIMIFCNSLTHRGRDLVYVRLLPKLDFVHDYKLFFFIRFDGECSAASLSKPRMANFNGAFNILGIMIDAANNDQILDTTGDKKFFAPQEAKILGS